MPILRRQITESPLLDVQPGVVDQDVDPAEPARHLLHQRLHLSHVRDISGMIKETFPGVQLRGGAAQLVLVASGDGDTRALIEKQSRRGQTNATATARYQSGFSR